MLWVILPTPLNQSGTVRGRAVAQYEQGDSYTDLLSKEKLSLLLSAEADLSENTLLSGGVTYQEDDPRGPMWGGLPVWFSDGTKRTGLKIPLQVLTGHAGMLNIPTYLQI